jgi:lipopolysaccharide export LptBFGC system permease protein LptF
MKQYFEAFMIITLIIMIVALLLGIPLMILWNWLMPSIFELREISFWEAVGLNILSGILFNKIYKRD